MLNHRYIRRYGSVIIILSMFFLCCISPIILNGITPCGWLDHTFLMNSDCVLKITGDAPKRIVFTPDGKYLFRTYYGTQKIRISDGKAVWSRNEEGDSIDISPDGEWLAIVKKEIYIEQLWKTIDGTTVWTIPTFNANSEDIRFSSDGQLLAFGGRRTRGDGFIFYIRSLLDGQQQDFHSTGRYLNALEFSPDSRLIAVANWGATQIWQVHTGEVLYTFKGDAYDVSFSPNGDLVAVIGNRQQLLGQQGVIKLIQISNGQILQQLTGQTGAIWSIDFSPDGSLLASGSMNGIVEIWDVQKKQIVKTIDFGFFEPAIFSVNFSPDGTLLAISRSDSMIYLFKVN